MQKDEPANFLPSPEIHLKEVVGRRAFGKDKHIFSNDGDVLHYKIDVFLDNRLGTGLSVDRLGVGQKDKKILKKLNPLGAAMGQSMEKEFRGWAQFPVLTFHKIAAPTRAIGEDNPYHAELKRDDYTTPAALRSFAFHVCVAASNSKLEFVPATSPTGENLVAKQ